jgi:DNA-binding NarL/FixJ family response regulator
MTASSMTGVAIVEDDVRYRQSLETWLHYDDAFEPVRSFGSAESLFREIERLRHSGESTPWQLVLMDFHLPGHDGIEATRRLKEFAPDIPVVMLTMFEDPPLILRAIAAGVDGYLLKKAGTGDMLAALEAITAGGAVLTPAVARHVLEQIRDPGWRRTGATGSSPLTAREQDVLACLVDGLTYAATADRLGIAFETVRTHVRRVYRKLRVSNARQAVRKAVRDRLVQPDDDDSALSSDS